MAGEAEVLPGWWQADLHSHTWASPDSKTDPKELVARARAVGLDLIAVTDHNTIVGALEAWRLAPDLIIVGEEIRTDTGGEILAYFVRDEVPSGLPVGVVLDRLRAQGAVIGVSHPVDHFRRGSAMGERRLLQIIDRVDALEVFNARCLLAADNRRAAQLAAKYGRAVTAGSDAHTLGEIGAARTILPLFGNGPHAFLSSLRQARTIGRLSGFWPHLASTAAKFKG